MCVSIYVYTHNYRYIHIYIYMYIDILSIFLSLLFFYASACIVHGLVTRSRMHTWPFGSSLFVRLIKGRAYPKIVVAAL